MEWNRRCKCNHDASEHRQYQYQFPRKESFPKDSECFAKVRNGNNNDFCKCLKYEDNSK